MYATPPYTAGVVRHVCPRIVTFTGGRARPNSVFTSNGIGSIADDVPARSSSAVNRFAATSETIGSGR